MRYEFFGARNLARSASKGLMRDPLLALRASVQRVDLANNRFVPALFDIAGCVFRKR